MGVASGLAGVAIFEMMVDVDEWLVYGLDRHVLDRSIAVLFVCIVFGTLNCGCNREVTSLLRWPLAQVYCTSFFSLCIVGLFYGLRNWSLHQ